MNATISGSCVRRLRSSSRRSASFRRALIDLGGCLVEVSAGLVGIRRAKPGPSQTSTARFVKRSLSETTQTPDRTS